MFFQIIADLSHIFQCIIEKNLLISGPTEFKPVLLKSQL